MSKELDYGLVQVLSGKHAGRAAYYDDDALNNRAIVYWGAPCLSDYAVIPKKNLKNISALEAAHLGWKLEVNVSA